MGGGGHQPYRNPSQPRRAATDALTHTQKPGPIWTRNRSLTLVRGPWSASPSPVPAPLRASIVRRGAVVAAARPSPPPSAKAVAPVEASSRAVVRIPARHARCHRFTRRCSAETGRRQPYVPNYSPE
ncbi:hypothetical protein SSOG_00394 [Streptomyces himastatinicus ATCC 53653]|uniref:Uncharacterized protein n=1 Tax=Streptomyces himastatinicus ATCC 53653 TaxID=457427 RepID=D9W9J4_9ACTN|nr:hypothetical protein SSOG_00394 [Streptomyces himastatinicus ATCC 53653]